MTQVLREKLSHRKQTQRNHRAKFSILNSNIERMSKILSDEREKRKKKKIDQNSIASSLCICI